MLVDYVLEQVYRKYGIQLRGCHPRDLINQALALASYRREPRRLTQALLAEAAESYFLVDRDSQKSSQSAS
jgi:hypothetical protein